MKQLKVSFLPIKISSLNTISDALDKIDSHKIDFMPWSEDETKTEARFAIAYGNDSIFLKYYVLESHPRAVYTRPNDPVYKDSCVEFFIAFEGEKKYYNFEFNFLGNALVGYGRDGKDRVLLPESLIRKIKAQTLVRIVKESAEGLVNWELTLDISFDLFKYHKISSLKGKTCSVNFNKCGDDLPEPHFLSWSDIQTESPDFHVLEYFGKMEFVSDGGNS